jgi:Golgi phosphoprotein 3
MTTLIRRTVKNTSSGTHSESASNNVLQSYENDGDRDDEHDNDDDKETRLTLMEEILLLGLKDREVCGLEF